MSHSESTVDNGKCKNGHRNNGNGVKENSQRGDQKYENGRKENGEMENCLGNGTVQKNRNKPSTSSISPRGNTQSTSPEMEANHFQRKIYKICRKVIHETIVEENKRRRYMATFDPVEKEIDVMGYLINSKTASRTSSIYFYEECQKEIFPILSVSSRESRGWEHYSDVHIEECLGPLRKSPKVSKSPYYGDIPTHPLNPDNIDRKRGHISVIKRQPPQRGVRGPQKKKEEKEEIKKEVEARGYHTSQNQKAAELIAQDVGIQDAQSVIKSSSKNNEAEQRDESQKAVVQEPTPVSEESPPPQEIQQMKPEEMFNYFKNLFKS